MIRNLKLILLFTILFSFFTSCLSGNDKTNQKQEELKMKYKGYVYAPEFPEDLEWLNSSKPISLKELRGKFVLLDFWTYCCINCMHVIPDLHKLENEFKNELVVIGVHSAKFKNEKDKDNIRKATLRYEITHPVVNDKNFEIWNDYSVSAWPTFVLINPLGQIIMQVSGEGIYSKLHTFLQAAITEFDEAKLLNKEEIKFTDDVHHNENSVLKFPGKIKVSNSGKLYITDSNNNRILITNLEGKILTTIGSGNIGKADGDFQNAEFYRPQGIEVDSNEEYIYVADTENHLIRKISLKEKKVETIAGKGYMAITYFSEGGFGTESELNSPWDLVLVGNTLYIAMAGPHQIWKMDLQTKKIEPFAGNGYENIVDGNLRNSSFAQPSGITYGDGKLYIADSEVSAIRQIDLNNGKVSTLAGTGLFDFGDTDGIYPKSRLQHCIGIHYFQGMIYIADTYNHKIKQLNPTTKELKTFLGNGLRGNVVGSPQTTQFYEPNAVYIFQNKMYITDTNNDLIKVYDFLTQKVNNLIIN